jgi:hypothetical protein
MKQLTQKYYTNPKELVKDKHSSLLLVNLEEILQENVFSKNFVFFLSR